MFYLHFRHGGLVSMNPRKLPIKMLLRGLLVIAQEPDLQPTKKNSRNPPIPPVTIPRNGFQKYQDLKNSLTDFGLGVVLQLDSIYVNI
jgi:hypothetical protein